jgi:hypothetical protein
VPATPLEPAESAFALQRESVIRRCLDETMSIAIDTNMYFGVY